MTKHLTLLLLIGLAWGQAEPDTIASKVQLLKKETFDNSVDDAKKTQFYGWLTHRWLYLHQLF